MVKIRPELQSGRESEKKTITRTGQDRTGQQTSSSAIAERPPDALCPSVVSLNKIITRVDSFTIVP